VKIKRHSRVNIILVLFLTVFIVGSALAFTVNGGFSFEGIVNVNSELRVEFIDARVIQISSEGSTAGSVTVYEERGLQSSSGHGRFVQMNSTFDYNGGRIRYALTLKNVGSMPARVVEFNLFGNIPDGFQLDMSAVDIVDKILRPGDTETIYFKFVLEENRSSSLGGFQKELSSHLVYEAVSFGEAASN